MKKNLLNLLLASSLMLAAPVVFAGREAPLENVEHQQLARQDGKPLTTAMVRQIITTVAISKGWQVQPVSDQLLQASINVRNKHTAVVLIHYTAKDFSIEYKDSTNLNYVSAEQALAEAKEAQERNRREFDQVKLPTGALIHPNYNRWVKGLAQDVSNAVSLANL
jgi:hypothetical protein